MPESRPWYHEGLRFHCTQCGNCCTGGPGAVWVSEDEIRKIAEFRESSVGETRINHTRQIGDRETLREFANGDCTFLDGQTRRCTIYAVRPAQCRTWPFWNSNLESLASWQLARQVCPGMDQGELITLETIQQQASIIDL